MLQTLHKCITNLEIRENIAHADFCEKHTEQQTFSSRFHTWAKDQYLVFGLSSKNNSIPLQFTLQLL